MINDQTFPEEAGNPDVTPPIPPNPAGSAASLHVTVIASKFEGNGFGALDRDGLRINEGGDGHLVAVIRFTRAIGNGANGIELDERGNGDVEFEIVGSHFSGNGSFDTSPVPDLDDGIDVDESAAGHLVGTVTLPSSNNNLEEGFDFNENDAGDFRVDVTSSWKPAGISRRASTSGRVADFAGGGDLITRLAGIKTNGNGAAGDAELKIREKGDGNLNAGAVGVEASDNLNRGVQLREDDGGSLAARVPMATTNGNASHGVDFDENSSGNVTALVADSRSRDNQGFGVRADNQAPGDGTLHLERVILSGNASGATGGSGVTVTQSP